MSIMTEEDLKQLKVSDVIAMPEFTKEMDRQIHLEQESIATARREAAIKGKRLQRTPVDSLMEKGIFYPEKMVELYSKVVEKALIGFSSMERQYIYGIGYICFGRVLVLLKERVKESEEK